MLKEPPSRLKKTKLGLILSKEKISFFSFAKAIIASFKAFSSSYLLKKSLDFIFFDKIES